MVYLVYFAYAMAWVSCAGAAIYGMHISNGLKPLLIMIVPLFLDIKINIEGE